MGKPKIAADKVELRFFDDSGNDLNYAVDEVVAKEDKASPDRERNKRKVTIYTEEGWLPERLAVMAGYPVRECTLVSAFKCTDIVLFRSRSIVKPLWLGRFQTRKCGSMCI